MTTFDDRENAYENMFAHNEELRFKAEARCNKLLALWAAKKLGKSEAESEAYVGEVIKSDFEEAGHDDVIRKVAADLGAFSSEDDVRAKRSELLREAQAQIADEN
ncbi:MAG: DUF1476 domain-containing protein [Maritimibacter sp.]